MRRLVPLLLLAVTLGCSTRVADLTIASHRKVDKKFPVVAEKVEGSDCATSVLFFPIGNTNPTGDAVIDDALAQADGADALVDATFSWYQLVTILYNRVCLRVEGTAVRTR
jgi:hypothetical protein